MSYVGMAANVIGGEMQGWAALADKWKMQDEINRQAALQDQYRSQATREGFAPALNVAGSNYAQQSLGQGTANRMQAYGNVGQAQLGLPGVYAPPPSARDLATVQSYAAPRAALGAYGDWATNQAIAAQAPQNKINQISSFARGDAGVFPYNLAKAQHSYDQLAAIGQMIAAIGGGSTNFSAYNQLYNAPQGGGGMVYNPYSFPADTQYNPYAVPAGGYQDWSNPGGQGLISSGLE